MKIKTDFVTNSSSTSFIICIDNDKELHPMTQFFIESLKNDWYEVETYTDMDEFIDEKSISSMDYASDEDIIVIEKLKEGKTVLLLSTEYNSFRLKAIEYLKGTGEIEIIKESEY